MRFLPLVGMHRAYCGRRHGVNHDATRHGNDDADRSCVGEDTAGAFVARKDRLEWTCWHRGEMATWLRAAGC